MSLHGYADVRGLFSGEWGEWPRAISLALALPVDELRDVRSGGPTPAYYDAYLAANAILNAASREVASLLQHLGYRATPYPATVSAGDLQADLGAALTAPVHHKAVATRAGLGWIGRSGLLVTRTLGPRVRLATVFTDMLLPVAAPIDAGQWARAGVVLMPVLPGPSRGTPGAWARPGRPWSMWPPVAARPSA